MNAGEVSDTMRYFNAATLTAFYFGVVAGFALTTLGFGVAKLIQCWREDRWLGYRKRRKTRGWLLRQHQHKA